MILNAIPDHKLVYRNILMGELAYIERDTNLLFVPFVEEIWRNMKTGQHIRVLANNRHRYNVKSPYFKNHFRKVSLTWSLLFSADPKTMLLPKP